MHVLCKRLGEGLLSILLCGKTAAVDAVPLVDGIAVIVIDGPPVLIRAGNLPRVEGIRPCLSPLSDSSFHFTPPLIQPKRVDAIKNTPFRVWKIKP